MNTMTFTQQIYEQVHAAIPNTTTRTFSSDCGKSVGYYGSITAQKLPISTNALICLAEVLECRKELLGRHSTNARLQHIQEAQQMIADEIANRMQSIQTGDYKIRKMIIGSVARIVFALEQQYYPLTFIM